MPAAQLPEFVYRKIYPLLYGSYNWLRGLAARVILKGSAYHCFICNHSFGKFLPVGYRYDVLQEKKIIGGGYRENAICPNCRSIDRERLVYYFIKSRKLLQPGMRVLHVAPERNIQKMIQCAGVEYISADLKSPLAEVKMDIQSIPFADNHFDAIICNHVLEHVTDDTLAMREFHRVLRPGGWAILQVPFSSVMPQTFEDPAITGSDDRKRIYGQPNHARMYGLDYPERLSAAGFKVQVEQTDPATAKLYMLNPDEPVFFCRK
jgi:SAM-dependent methyltransferase